MNTKLLKKIDKFRQSYICKRNCEEWKRWQYCIHLRKAIEENFGSEMNKEISNLICKRKIIGKYETKLYAIKRWVDSWENEEHSPRFTFRKINQIMEEKV